MGINPWPVGQLDPITIPLTQESKTVDLTGLAANQLSVILYSTSTVNGVKTYTLIGASNGTISIVQYKPGIIGWTPASGDVAAAGTFAFRVKINTIPHFFDYIDWTIQV